MVTAVQCPPESQPGASGACISSARCPEGTRREEGAGCVETVVTCPEGSHSDGGHCVADVVVCPQNSHRTGEVCEWNDARCPAGAELRAGRCVLVPTGDCGSGFRREGDVCVADACLEGNRRDPERGCVNLCEAYPHARWTRDRGCTCDEGYEAAAQECRRECGPGMRRQGETCVPGTRIICPDGYVGTSRGQCVEREIEAPGWQNHFTLRISLGIGGGGLWLAETDRAHACGGDLCWGSRGDLPLTFSPQASLTFENGFTFGAGAWFLDASYDQPGATLVALTGEVGTQVSGERYAHQILIVGAYGLGSDGSYANFGGVGIAYRFLYRLGGGFFMGLQSRGLLVFSDGSFNGWACGRECTIATPNRVGALFGGEALLGWAFY